MKKGIKTDHRKERRNKGWMNEQGKEKRTQENRMKELMKERRKELV